MFQDVAGREDEEADDVAVFRTDAELGLFTGSVLISGGVFCCEVLTCAGPPILARCDGIEAVKGSWRPIGSGRGKPTLEATKVTVVDITPLGRKA